VDASGSQSLVLIGTEPGRDVRRGSTRKGRSSRHGGKCATQTGLRAVCLMGVPTRQAICPSLPRDLLGQSDGVRRCHCFRNRPRCAPDPRPSTITGPQQAVLAPFFFFHSFEVIGDSTGGSADYEMPSLRNRVAQVSGQLGRHPA